MDGLNLSRSLVRLFAFGCLTLLCGAATWGQDVQFSERDQSRAQRLDKMSDSMSEVNVVKQKNSGDEKAEGRRQSDVSELRFRFLVCASGLVHDNKDGMLLFPMQVSGFTSTITPGRPAQRKHGSDFVEIRVEFVGLIGQDTPKAEIKLPAFQQGSTFPAEDLVREEIQKRIEKFLPEAEIQGRQRRREKQLRIENKTKETLRVFVHRRTNEFQKGKGYQWIWAPSEPGERPQVAVVPAGESLLLESGGGDSASKPATAQRLRIWAESESGQRWTDYHEKDLWLVEKNPDFDDERVYYSEKIETYTHAFEPQPGPHVYTERVLTMRNEAPQPLSVSLEYRTTEDGSAKWRKAEFTISANETYEPKNDLGMRIRASRVRFGATSEDRRYETHQEEDLWLVSEQEGQRAYQADEIGEFRYVFLAAAKDVDTATVTAASANVKSGTDVLGVVKRGQKFDVLEQKGDWTRIAYQKDGERIAGWVQKKDLSIDRPAPKATPDSSRQRFRVTSNSADVKIGTETLARVSPGQEYDILEERSGWYRIEIRIGGEVRHGMVQKRHGVIAQ